MGAADIKIKDMKYVLSMSKDKICFNDNCGPMSALHAYNAGVQINIVP
jgi:hypothetical protein